MKELGSPPSYPIKWKISSKTTQEVWVAEGQTAYKAFLASNCGHPFSAVTVEPYEEVKNKKCSYCLGTGLITYCSIFEIEPCDKCSPG